MPPEQQADQTTGDEQQVQQSSLNSTSANGSDQTPEYLTKEDFGATLKEALASEGILKEASDTGMSQADVEALMKAQRDTILKDVGKALSGEPDKPQIDPLTRQIITNPQETLRVYGDMLREEWREEMESERAANYEIAQLGSDLRKQRPDIAKSERAQKLFTNLYKLTDTSKTPRERFAAATTDFDALLEESGLGSAEDRVKKAQTSLDSASGSGQSQQKDDDKLGEELMQKELEDRQARHRKLKNLD